MTESFDWSAEKERKDALAEITALRRELKTETSKGAKAAQSDPRFIAAQQRLDAAKSAVGMRTSAEDLAALNRIATSDTATVKTDKQGRITPAPTKAERAVTKQLNAPSRQYFKKRTEASEVALRDPNQMPSFEPKLPSTPEIMDRLNQLNIDSSKAKPRWVWFENPETGESRWGVGLVGLVEKAPEKPQRIDWSNAVDYAGKLWRSDSGSIGQINKNIVEQYASENWNMPAYFNKTAYESGRDQVLLSELADALPKLKYSEFQEILYQLSIERDEDITLDDIKNKYKEMYGEK